MDLAEHMASWFARHENDLRRLGELVFEQKIRVSGDRRTTTVVLGVGSDSHFAEMLVWDSGEVEYGFGTFERQTDEHHDVGSLTELDELLSRFLTFANTFPD